jgi:hypothetical protein
LFAVVVVTIPITITIAIIIIAATISTATYYPPRPAQYSSIRNQAIQWYSGCGGVFVMVVISVLPPYVPNFFFKSGSPRLTCRLDTGSQARPRRRNDDLDKES